MTSPIERAREAIALAEKATLGKAECVQDHICTRDDLRFARAAINSLGIQTAEGK